MSGRLLFPIAALLVLALLIAHSERSVRLQRANGVLHQAEQSTQRALAAGRSNRQLLQLNLARLKAAAEMAPADSRILLAVGSHYLLLGNRSAAIRWYRQALELEPRPEIHFNLARALHQAERVDEAREHFRAAVRLDPKRRSDVPPELRDEI